VIQTFKPYSVSIKNYYAILYNSDNLTSVGHNLNLPNCRSNSDFSTAFMVVYYLSGQIER
jgi:hypothetical protein